MKELHVDARGKPCPQPVLLTRQAILESGADTIRVTLDSPVSAANVERMGRSQGWSAREERQGDSIQMVLTREDGTRDEALEREALACELSEAQPKVVIFVGSNLLGTGEEELGRILMRAFVKTIREVQPRPAVLIFANSGVRLTTQGSDLIDDLRALEAEGTEVLSCGTCLDYYRLQESLAVGRASNMYEIASALVGADRVVRP